MKSVTFKAVCYQCSFEGRSESSLCPVCSFPVILEPENTPPGGFRLEDILARDRVRAETAPPLPGVDPGKRQAQIRAEERRERRVSQQRPAVAVRLPSAPPILLEDPRKRIRGGTVAAPRSSWGRRVAIGVLCASAVAAGVLAAAFQAGR
ncbi:MAG TPA: hypothetical protein VMZ28_30035 [Kofleriaceae bacterium]|nr:hypothetical protein [Kofleriaceae bacterium]